MSSEDQFNNPLQGRWEAEDPATAFLEFRDAAAGGGLLGGKPGEGTLSGSDGCNGVGGWYTPDGVTATIRRGLNTLKACPGVNTWLSKAASVRADGTTLHVYDRAGDEIGVLTRAAPSSRTRIS